MAVLMPTCLPSRSNSGPPELPWLIAAVCCTASVSGATSEPGTSYFVAVWEMFPTVAESWPVPKSSGRAVAAVPG